MSSSLVVLSHISKSFEKSSSLALDNIDAQFPFGRLIGLAGPDGAGKTTLMRILAGLLTPSSGSVTIHGFDTLKNPQQVHEIISYMPQKFGLYEDLTVIQNLDLYAELQGLEVEKKEKRFEELLSFTGLAPFTKRLAGNLSGGMKQKLGLACTLLRKPKLLLLDEPTVGVDPISRKELWKMIFDLLHDQITVVCSTAYLDEVEKCDDVLLLDEGKVLYFGSPKELTDKMVGKTFHIESALGSRRALLSAVIQDPNVIDGVIQGSSVRLVLKDATDPSHLQNLPAHTTIQSVAPRFEDAFMNILGGSRKGISPLIELTPDFAKVDKPIVEARKLTKCFGQFTAAHNIEFSVKRGEIFGLLGPNGAGKSTTFKMLCGLLKPTSGEAHVAGYSLQQASGQARARIGYMAQKFSLYGNMTVLQNLRFFSGIYPTTDKSAEENVQEMIRIFDLQLYQDTITAKLPLGFKQRLALACSIMHHPEVLFLDEPTSGVDPITRREFWSHINGMVEKGVAIIVTTHFMDEAEYCDRIGLINHGELIRIGSPDELKNLVRNDTLPNPTLEDAFIALSLGEKGADHAL